MSDKTKSQINPDGGDDQVIAVAFKRSLWVILLAVVAVGGWFGLQKFQQEDAEQVNARVIRPQPVEAVRSAEPPVVKFTDITASAGINHTHVDVLCIGKYIGCGAAGKKVQHHLA